MVKSKTRNRIAITRRYRTDINSTTIGMIQFVFSIVKRFQIVFCRAWAVHSRVPVIGTSQRHHHQIGLVFCLMFLNIFIIFSFVSKFLEAIFTGFIFKVVGKYDPYSAGPPIADFCSVLSRNPLFSFFIANLPESVVNYKAVKLNCILVSLIVNINNGGIITRNGFLRNRLCGKSFIRLGNCFSLLAGLSVQTFAFMIRKFIIVCIFPPVHNRILGISDFPAGINSSRYCNSRKISLLGQCRIFEPAGESVTASGRSSRSSRFICGEKLRCDVAAAIGFVSDPKTFLNIRIQENAACLLVIRQRSNFVFQFLIRIPACYTVRAV